MQPRWRSSPTTAAARTLAADDVCFSNVPEAVYLWAGRPCRRALLELYRTTDRRPDQLLTHLASGNPHRVFYLWYYDRHPDDRMIGDPRTLLAPNLVRRQPTADGELLELRTIR
jgi:hypothetical protein